MQESCVKQNSLFLNRMKFKFFSQISANKIKSKYLPLMEIIIKQSFHLIIFLQHYRLTTSGKTSTFLSPQFSYSLHKVLYLIFGFFLFFMNSICILFNKLIIDEGISVTKARWIIFEITNDIKIAFFSSKVKFLSFHNFKMF